MSCLFDSLSQFTTHTSLELRERIVEFLSTNPPLMDDAPLEQILQWESVDMNQYLGSMRQSSTWGGAIEIKAFVNMYKVNVFVHIPNQHQRIVEFVYNQAHRDRHPTVHILWTGNHFIPLFPHPTSPNTLVQHPHPYPNTSIAIRSPPSPN